MSKAFLGPRPNAFDPARDEALARNLERLAWLMDRAFHIPGTKITVGLDALLGLLPIGGDVLTGLVQAGLVLVALRHYHVPRMVAARMMANVLIDIAIGAIPVLGDLFDVAFKANTRNLQLLEPYRHQEAAAVERPIRSAPLAIGLRPVGTPWRLIVPIALILFVALGLVLIGFVAVVRWLFHF
jgi:hypothetical protein